MESELVTKSPSCFSKSICVHGVVCIHTYISICMHLGAQVCGIGSLSPRQRVWSGSLVCGQKTERLLPGASDLTVREATVENKALCGECLRTDRTSAIAKIHKWLEMSLLIKEV